MKRANSYIFFAFFLSLKGGSNETLDNLRQGSAKYKKKFLRAACEKRGTVKSLLSKKGYNKVKNDLRKNYLRAARKERVQ